MAIAFHAQLNDGRKKMINHGFTLYRAIFPPPSDVLVGQGSSVSGVRASMSKFLSARQSAKCAVAMAFTLGLVINCVAAEELRAPATIIKLNERHEGECVAEEGQALIQVNVLGLQNTEGRMRAQIYSSDPDEFLEKGMKLVGVDMPIDGAEEPTLCVPLPTPGTYALAVLHDKNANGRADFFSEGFGFSNNPKLSLGPPDADEVMFVADAGVSQHDITLSYIFGGDEKKKEKRRKLKRR